MKNLIKNIAAVIMLGGLFFIPVFSSAQNSESIANDSNNLLSPSLNNDKSQTELEAAEQILILIARLSQQSSYQNSAQQIKSRILSSISNEMENDKSQAEVEAAEELLYIQTIMDFQNIITIDLIQASNKAFYLISDPLASNYDEEMNEFRNLR